MDSDQPYLFGAVLEVSKVMEQQQGLSASLSVQTNSICRVALRKSAICKDKPSGLGLTFVSVRLPFDGQRQLVTHGCYRERILQIVTLRHRHDNRHLVTQALVCCFLHKQLKAGYFGGSRGFATRIDNAHFLMVCLEWKPKGSQVAFLGRTQALQDLPKSYCFYPRSFGPAHPPM